MHTRAKKNDALSRRRTNKQRVLIDIKTFFPDQQY